MHLMCSFCSVGNKEWPIHLTFWNHPTKKKRESTENQYKLGNQTRYRKVTYVGPCFEVMKWASVFPFLYSYNEPLITTQIWFQRLGYMTIYGILCDIEKQTGKCCKMPYYWFLLKLNSANYPYLNQQTHLSQITNTALKEWWGDWKKGTTSVLYFSFIDLSCITSL